MCTFGDSRICLVVFDHEVDAFASAQIVSSVTPFFLSSSGATGELKERVELKTVRFFWYKEGNLRRNGSGCGKINKGGFE